MTRDTWPQYKQARDEFTIIANPTKQQCLKYLRVKVIFFSKSNLMENCYIPIEHREFCKIQLKLEGLL